MLRPVTFLLAAAWLAGCAAAPSGKPQLDPARDSAARPNLQAYLARAVGGGDKAVELTEAEQFLEGHVYETWRLKATVGGAPAEYTLKVFPDEAMAERDVASHRQARELGWPVPQDVARGPLLPYSPKFGSLRVYVPGDSLSMKLRARLRTGEAADKAAVATLYAQIGEALGRLHLAGRRARRDGDISGAAEMRELVERCGKESWCGPDTVKDMEAAAAKMDGEEVTFIHGDLYEAQVIVDDAGKLVSFIDLDEAGFGDPALDLGALLAHVLLVNPETRQARWGVANPEPEEVRATASALLEAYRLASGVGDAWPAFAARLPGYVRLRVGRLLLRLADNPHAKTMMKTLDKRKAALLAADPFTRFGVQP